MREGIIVEVSATDRARLEAVVADRNSPQKHVWRARIILATANTVHFTIRIAAAKSMRVVGCGTRGRSL